MKQLLSLIILTIIIMQVNPVWSISGSGPWTTVDIIVDDPSGRTKFGVKEEVDFRVELDNQAAFFQSKWWVKNPGGSFVVKQAKEMTEYFKDYKFTECGDHTVKVKIWDDKWCPNGDQDKLTGEAELDVEVKNVIITNMPHYSSEFSGNNIILCGHNNTFDFSYNISPDGYDGSEAKIIIKYNPEEYSKVLTGDQGQSNDYTISWNGKDNSGIKVDCNNNPYITEVCVKYAPSGMVNSQKDEENLYIYNLDGVDIYLEATNTRAQSPTYICKDTDKKFKDYGIDNGPDDDLTTTGDNTKFGVPTACPTGILTWSEVPPAGQSKKLNLTNTGQHIVTVRVKPAVPAGQTTDLKLDYESKKDQINLIIFDVIFTVTGATYISGTSNPREYVVEKSESLSYVEIEAKIEPPSAASALQGQVILTADNGHRDPANPMKWLIPKNAASLTNVNVWHDGQAIRSAKVYVIFVDLQVAGVANNDDEENPGVYIPLNNDDDNSNGTLDNEENPVSGENDLKYVRMITEPSECKRGLIKLEVSYTALDGIKFWQDDEKNTEFTGPAPPLDAYITPTSPGQWYPVSVVIPDEFYIEGNNTSSSERDVELKLSWKIDVVKTEDIINGTVIGLTLYKNAENWTNNKELEDNTLFFINKAVGIEVKPIFTSPVKATVYSSIEADKKLEISLNSDVNNMHNSNTSGPFLFNIFNETDNTINIDNLLDLNDDENNFIDVDLKIGSKEVKFDKKNKVDFAEYGTTFGEGEGFTSSQDADNISAGLENMLINGNKWHKAADLRGSAVTESSVIDLVKKTDLCYISGHGRYSWDSANNKFILYDHVLISEVKVILPSDVGDWGTDAEWVVIVGCHFLAYTSQVAPKANAAGDPAVSWGNVMKASKLHALLGYREGAPPSWDQTPSYWITDYEIANNFINKLSSQSIKDAWLNANAPAGQQYAYKREQTAIGPGIYKYYSPLFAVAIFRDDNVSDKIDDNDNITKDSINDNFTYYYISWDWAEEKDFHVKNVSFESISMP